MFLFKRFFLPCGRQNDMLVISNASERSHTKCSLIRRFFGAPRPRMTAFTKASSQVSFRTHVRNLNLSFFSVRFFTSLRSVQNDMFVISVCEGSHRKRTIWRKMFYFTGARSEWWWGVTAVRVWSCRRNRQTRFSVRSGIVTFASDYFSSEGTYKWQAM